MALRSYQRKRILFYSRLSNTSTVNDLLILHHACRRRRIWFTYSLRSFAFEKMVVPKRFCDPLLLTVGLFFSFASAYVPPPPTSPATNLPNRVYEWRSQRVRYQMAGDPSSPHTAVLIHGLFVNSDHWRRTLKGLADAGYRAYAIDLLGSGYTTKPAPWDKDTAQIINGESRFANKPAESILKDVTLGTASGGSRVSDVDLRHPLGSPYNFYTWAEQIADFTRDVVLNGEKEQKTTLVCNSIGTISSLQSVLDSPELFDGVFSVAPNFRELHSAEVAFPGISMPFVRSLQAFLRNKGQGLFDALAKPSTVKQILQEPYAISSAVDDVLVDVLLTPLLTPGASDVVFDTLSYSAGPLPEQQLQQISKATAVPVWVSYGTADPWTPGERVERLKDLDAVERVIAFNGVGHCPHDEAPELVNPLLLEFMDRVKENSTSGSAVPGTAVKGVAAA